MTIDYRTLLAEACEASCNDYLDAVTNADRNVEGGASQELLDSPYTSEADAILATRIPGLPIEATIADLLRWGENVAKAKVMGDHFAYIGCVHTPDGRCFDADDVGLLAALRTEADR